MSSEAISIERQIACVRREVGLRKRVYPRWVSQARMSQPDADGQIAAMEAALATLKRVRDEQQSKVAPELF